ncbi:PTS glucose transporter subunit IIA [Enterococcus asini]|nr:PTS glucose transporter subunit IIA [Enterococcus asini]
MFGVFKKKKAKTKVLTPVAGEVIKIEAVADPVFNQKMMGEGFAVKPANGKISSPIKGQIKAIFPTKHALTIEGENGLNLLIHVGLDTVDLNGKGFDISIAEGQRVSAGDTLLSVDLEVLKSNDKDNSVIVVFPEQPDLELFINEGVFEKVAVAAVVN